MMPPYSKSLVAARRLGQIPESETVALHVDYSPPKSTDPRIAHLATFHGQDPSELDFACVKDLDVFALRRRNTPNDRLRAVLRAVLAGEPRRLVVLAEAGPFWIKSVARGLEFRP